MHLPHHLCDRCDVEITPRQLRDAAGIFGKSADGVNIAYLLCKACKQQILLVGSCWAGQPETGDPFTDFIRTYCWSAFLIGEFEDLAAVTEVLPGDEFLASFEQP